MTANHERASWLINKIRGEEDYLTEWETNFFYDIWERLEKAAERGYTLSLTEKQMETLEKIGAKVV